MRIFGGDRINRIMRLLDGGLKDEAIESGMVTRSIEKAQRKVEARNFDIRKQLLVYDDVANDQRKVIYAQRKDPGHGRCQRGHRGSAPRRGPLIHEHMPEGSLEEQWDLRAWNARCKGVELQLKLQRGWLKQEPELEEAALRERIVAEAVKRTRQSDRVGAEIVPQ